MEVNRDEAERCIDIATAALSNDQPEKAQRFLEKAQRLFPTEKAKGELKLVKMAELGVRDAGFSWGGTQHHQLQDHLHPGWALRPM